MNELNYNELINSAREHSESNTIIIAFANNTYRLVLENWIFQINRLQIKNYLIFTLDQKIERYCKQNNINSFKLYSPSQNSILKLEDLWLLRVEIFFQLINSDLNFIHSDIDAVWLKNPIKKYVQETSSCLIFSQGTVFPQKTLNIWGFVLCAGFFSIKSNPLTQSFLKDLLSKVKISKNDQKEINLLLCEKYTIQWDKQNNTTYDLKRNKKKFECYTDILKGNFKNHPNEHIDLLPQKLFQRLPSDTDEAYIKHCLSDNYLYDKLKMLKKTESLFIQPALPLCFYYLKDIKLRIKTFLLNNILK